MYTTIVGKKIILSLLKSFESMETFGFKRDYNTTATFRFTKVFVFSENGCIAISILFTCVCSKQLL